MERKPLTELIYDLEQEMLRLGYTEGSMKFYRAEWRMLIKFAEERGEVFFSEQLGIDFIEKHLKIFEKDSNHKLLQSEVQKLRIIRLLGDFQLHHTILRRYYNHKEILTDPYFLGISNKFRSYCESKNYSRLSRYWSNT